MDNDSAQAESCLNQIDHEGQSLQQGRQEVRLSQLQVIVAVQFATLLPGPRGRDIERRPLCPCTERQELRCPRAKHKATVQSGNGALYSQKGLGTSDNRLSASCSSLLKYTAREQGKHHRQCPSRPPPRTRSAGAGCLAYPPRAEMHTNQAGRCIVGLTDGRLFAQAFCYWQMGTLTAAQPAN